MINRNEVIEFFDRLAPGWDTETVRDDGVIRIILDHAPIRQIYTNGRKSQEIYEKYCRSMTGRDSICLPSTSPANAAWNLQRLQEAWKVIL